MDSLVKLHTNANARQRYDGAFARIQQKNKAWSRIVVESTDEVLVWRTDAWTNCEVNSKKKKSTKKHREL